MSAYLCSNKHISAIVRSAIPGSGHNTFSFYWKRPGDDREARYEMKRDELGKMLFDENIRSLKARYGDEEESSGFKMEEVERPDAINGLKLCNGYAYQSCESDDWMQTKAFAALLAIKEKLIRELPGYDDAEWSL